MPQETDGQHDPIVRLTLVTHNDRLVTARKDRGWNGDIFSELVGITRSRLRRIETLKNEPTEEEKIRIAIQLEKDIDYLFPESLMRAVSRGVFKVTKRLLKEPQLISLAEVNQNKLLPETTEEQMVDEADRGLLAQYLTEMLDKLPKMEREVLLLRFGLKDGRCYTFDEIAQLVPGKLGDLVTKSRIQQIEGKALRLLRRPRYSEKLRGFLTREE